MVLVQHNIHKRVYVDVGKGIHILDTLQVQLLYKVIMVLSMGMAVAISVIWVNWVEQVAIANLVIELLSAVIVIYLHDVMDKT